MIRVLRNVSLSTPIVPRFGINIIPNRDGVEVVIGMRGIWRLYIRRRSDYIMTHQQCKPGCSNEVHPLSRWVIDTAWADDYRA